MVFLWYFVQKYELIWSYDMRYFGGGISLSIRGSLKNSTEFFKTVDGRLRLDDEWTLSRKFSGSLDGKIIIIFRELY